MKSSRIAKGIHLFETGTHLSTLQCSDIHFDSLECDHDSLKAHFDKVKEKDGKIFIYGDLFDVMGCYKDPRTKNVDVNPIYVRQGRSYIDLVIEDVFEFLKPYRENIAFIGYGNHETAILKWRDTDPIDRLVFLLNQMPGNTVQKGNYSGWVLLNMQRQGGTTTSFKIRYHHGKGGTAKRSKGILYAQLDAMEYPDANMIVSGHDHNKIYDPSNVRKRLSHKNDRVYQDTVHWIKLGSYAHSPENDGYVVEKGYMAKRLGGWFIDFDYVRVQKDGIEHSYVEPTVYEAHPVRR